MELNISQLCRSFIKGNSYICKSYLNLNFHLALCATASPHVDSFMTPRMVIMSHDGPELYKVDHYLALLHCSLLLDVYATTVHVN